MSATICRLPLSLASVAAAAVLYFVVFFIMIEVFWSWRHDDLSLWVSNFVSLGALVGSWMFIWAGPVRFTTSRLAWTGGLLAIIGAGMAVVYFGIAEASNEEEIGIIIGGMLGAVVWLIGAPIMWRETAAERAARLARQGIQTIACPTCGYNLTGLREASCPECGSRYTLDQLYATLTEQHAEVR